MPAGRPTEYNEEMLKKAQEYIEMCNDDEIEKTKIGRGGGEVVEYKIKVKMPTKGGLARFLGVHRDTLYQWSKEYEQFSDIMEQLGAEQEDRLINNGLSGDYNPTIAKVLLTKHGYREGIDATTNNKDVGTVLLNPVTQALAQEYESKLKENL